jgi:hypothetical protein
MKHENLSRAALTVEHDSAYVGSALTAFRARYAWNWHDLSRWLGVGVDQIHAMAREPLAAVPVPADFCEELATRYAANAARLASILSGSSGATASGGQNRETESDH